MDSDYESLVVIFTGETYSDILSMSHNEAYERTVQERRNNATNVYEEISPPPAVSSCEPVYTEISEQSSKKKDL